MAARGNYEFSLFFMKLNWDRYLPGISFAQRLYQSNSTPSMAYRKRKYSSTGLSSRYKRRRYNPTMTMNKRRSTTGTGVTSQYDAKFTYRKKYMPRRKKRVWRKFSKKVNAVLAKSLGSKTVVINSQLTGSSLTGNQILLGCHVYGKDGLADLSVLCGAQDLQKIVNNDATLNASSKIHFHSAVMDITITNTSRYVAAEDEALNAASLEIDIYEIAIVRNGDAQDILGCFSLGAADTGNINAAQPGLALSQRGVTPFDFPEALSRFGLKILSKKKYLLGQKQNCTFQYRDPRHYVLGKAYIDDPDNNFMVPNQTKAFLIIAKGVPTADPTKVNSVLQVGVTRKYLYKINEDNDDWDNYLP